MRTTAFIGSSVRKAQGCIPPQLGDQAQPTLTEYVKSRIVAEMTIQNQVNRLEQALDPWEKRFNHLLNSLQFW